MSNFTDGNNVSLAWAAELGNKPEFRVQVFRIVIGLYPVPFLDVARSRSDARPDFRSGRNSWEAIPRRGGGEGGRATSLLVRASARAVAIGGL
eukprot:1005536-Prorocentrum_minimum.AAC.1